MSTHKFFLDFFIIFIAMAFIALVLDMGVFWINPVEWLTDVIKWKIH